MLARIEKLRENALRVHKELQEQRVLLQELRENQQQQQCRLKDGSDGVAAARSVEEPLSQQQRHDLGEAGFTLLPLLQPVPAGRLTQIQKQPSSPLLPAVVEPPRGGVAVNIDMSWTV